jgi:hypothetical protein
MSRESAPIRLRLISAVALLLSGCFQALAGDVTTDNLTVYQTATVHGNVNVASQVAVGAVSTNSLKLHYMFITNGNGRAVDYSGNNKTGTVFGATYQTSGKVNGGGYDFDGNDYIGTVLNPNGWNEVTMAAWVYADTWSAYDGVIVARNGSDVLGLLTCTSPTCFRFYHYFGGNSLYVNSTVTVGPGVWYHVAATYSKATGSAIYVNGVRNGTTTSNGTVIVNNTFNVGRDPYDSSRYLDGCIDEVVIYNRALSSNEVRNLYLYNGTNFPNPKVDIAAPAVFRDSVVFSNQVRTSTAQGDISMGTYTNHP